MLSTCRMFYFLEKISLNLFFSLVKLDWFVKPLSLGASLSCAFYRSDYTKFVTSWNSMRRTIPNSLPHEIVWGHCEPNPAETSFFIWLDQLCIDVAGNFCVVMGLSFSLLAVNIFVLISFFSSSWIAAWTVSATNRVTLHHWHPMQVIDVILVSLLIILKICHAFF